MFRTELPGAYCYVVPFSTVDPDRIEISEPRRTPKGEFRIADWQERQNPLSPSTLRFQGPHPQTARRLAKRKISWQEATGPAPLGVVEWQATFHRPEAMRRVLSDTIRRARTTGR